MRCSRCGEELGNIGEYAVCETCGAINTEIIFVNCTPHAIHEIITSTDFPPSGHVARCSVHEETDRLWNDIPIHRVSYGAVDGLPAPADRTIYIVSLLVRQALPDRKDLVTPGELTRDAAGQPIGCRGFRL